MSSIRQLVGLSALFAMTATGTGCSASAAPVSPEEVDARAVAFEAGNRSAPIHVIYFDDYVCDDCKHFNAEAIVPLRKEWVGTGRARLTLVDVAWKRGSVAGAAAAWCAKEQGKFWEMHDLLFDRQDTWKRAVDIPAALASYASELRLDSAKYASCAERKTHRQRLDDAEDATRRFGVRGTPAFVINGRLYYGSQQWSWIQQVLMAYASGHPESAPPPPLKLPTKQVVDSVRLKALRDSLSKNGTQAHF